MLRSQTTQQRLSDSLKEHLGETIMNALTEPTLTDVVCNPDGRVMAKRFGDSYMTIAAMLPYQAHNLIASVAGILGDVANQDNPVVEGELGLYDCRFTGVLPPIAAAPSFTIRKPSDVIPLENYLHQGIINHQSNYALRDALSLNKNIVVAGETGSGKTTLVSSMANEIDHITPNQRIVLIEDTKEIKLHLSNRVELRTKEGYTLSDLIRLVLRFDPDRIIVGEVRGAEAYDLLKLWWTGHKGGLCSIHANGNPQRSDERLMPLYRLEQMIAGATQVANVKHFIGEAVDTLITIAPIKQPPFRRVTSVSHVDYDDGGYRINPII